MQPCDKGPALERIESKLDQMTSIMVAVAEQKIDSKYVHEKLNNHEDRLKSVEGQPLKKLMVIYAGFVSMVSGLFIWLVKG